MIALSPKQQAVKEIVYDQGETYERAAEWLKMAAGTVRFHAWRVRDKYRAAGQPLPDNRRHFVRK